MAYARDSALMDTTTAQQLALPVLPIAYSVQVQLDFVPNALIIMARMGQEAAWPVPLIVSLVILRCVFLVMQVITLLGRIVIHV